MTENNILIKIGKDKKIRFSFPGDSYVVNMVKSILSNITYPIPPFLPDLIDCVFDIGANVGAFSVNARLRIPGVPLYAFEPNPKLIPFLEQNIAGLDEIHLYETALSNEDGVAILKLGGTAGESSSLNDGPHTASGDSYVVNLQDAGAVVPRLAGGANSILIKIDTEGCELEILQSINEIFPKIAAVFFEYHSENDRRKIDAFLAEHQMILFNSKADFCHRGNVLYIRDNILSKSSPHANWAIVRRPSN